MITIMLIMCGDGVEVDGSLCCDGGWPVAVGEVNGYVFNWCVCF